MSTKITFPKVLKFIFRFAVVAGMTVIAGYIVSFMAIIAFCTAGIGLIVLIPVLGVMLPAIWNGWRWVFGKPPITKKGPKKPPQVQALPSELQALYTYIIAAQTGGMARQEIIATLKSTGWRDDQIQGVLAFIPVPQAAPITAQQVSGVM